jgi:16S rRNA processing protein RimM
MNQPANDFVTIAKLAKTQGRLGELAADLFTDFPERFEDRRDLWAWMPNGERREVKLEGYWPHRDRVVLKFAGVDSINDAEKLIGAEIQIRREQRQQLTDGSAYISDLVGCSVAAASGEGELQELGKVTDLQRDAGAAPLLEVKGAAREYLIPWVEGFITKMDLAARRIELKVPEGLLDLDAPLSNEERDDQKRGNS